MSKTNHLAYLLNEIGNEVKRAQESYAPMHSYHEGYAVIKEEVDELWDEIKAWKGDDAAICKEVMDECIHVAAMAVRLCLDKAIPAQVTGGRR